MSAMAKLPPIATRSLPPQRETGFLAGLVGFFMGATGSFLLFLAIAATCGGVLYSMQAAKTQSAAQAYAPQTYASSETPLAPANPSRRRWSRVVMRATSMLLVASAIVGLSPQTGQFGSRRILTSIAWRVRLRAMYAVRSWVRNETIVGPTSPSTSSSSSANAEWLPD